MSAAAPAPQATPTPTATGTTPTDPTAVLAELFRAGDLAREYPRVRDLLAELPDDQLERAGRLLDRVGADAVLAAHPDTPLVPVVVTGHGTVAPLVPLLTAQLARHGLLLRARVGDFGGYLDELAGADGTELVLALLDPQLVFDQVPLPWQPEDVARTFAAKIDLIERLLTDSTAPVVLNTIALPRTFPAQLVDHRSRATLGAVWREANARLLRLPQRHPSVVVLDLDPWAADGIGVRDARLSVYARAHLSPALLHAYARDVAHLARARTGGTRKVLALDLDDTVWGGVLGEVGPDGVQVAETHRGEAFRAFQRVVKQLGAQGVLVAAVSKNDPGPVRTTLRDHPGMTLREDDFVRVVANWRPKHENLRDLAADLNVGLDSVVFVDDNPFERGLVRRELPSVAVVAVHDDPAGHVERLLADGWFDTLALTAEDRERPQRYREDGERRDFLHSFDSLRDYLAELGVRVRLSVPTAADVPRVSQLTLRTNQFNLTTRRLSPDEVAALLDDPAGTVLAVRSGDRFGDNGLVGAVFLRRAEDVLHIDNFLLSCRVFSRGVETATLAEVLRHARDTGVAAVTAEYRPTARNAKVAEFYPRNGFVRLDGSRFRHDLTDIPPPPEHVELTGSWPPGGQP
ncbi:HAD-IIIC family phosphatase [Micromonospora matsumotoense]|uniref:HAD-IIIC family phosphatase n=1 Tax=Micromonospora matsumotoense TaxID=121616 RepID=UPI00342AB6AC